jgi:hypothetical protein
MHGYLMIYKIDSSELTVYKNHCTLHRDRCVIRRLFCQESSRLFTLQFSQYVLIYDLLYEFHNS